VGVISLLKNFATLPPTRLAALVRIARLLFCKKFARILSRKTIHLPNLENLGADRLQSCLSRASLTAPRLRHCRLRTLRACSQWMRESYRGIASKPPQPTTQTMRHICTIWNGIEAGWQPVGRPNTKADAQRLATLRARINPHRLYRIAALAPELPSFV